MAKITIDNKEYDMETMSEQAKSALGALQFTDAEIQRLQAKLAAMQTARMAYVNGLKQALEEVSQKNTTSELGHFASETIQFK